MGSIHDSFVQNQPNSYTSVMVLVTDVLLMLAFLGFPLSVSARRKLRSTIHCQCAVSSWQEVGTMAFYCRTWLVYCHWVDGKSQKLANIIGSHVTDGSDMATRLALFHIWRYMNLAIFLCYKPMVQRVSS